MIEVVAGVVVHEGVDETRRMLLTQRPANKPYPYAWECPGGKVREGEGHFIALRRELREELNLPAYAEGSIAEGPCWTGELTLRGGAVPGDIIRIFFYLVRPDSVDIITRREGQGLGWFERHEINALEFASSLTPANARAHGAIIKAAFQ
jgi:8-oxo-dGTP diphosphatase